MLRGYRTVCLSFLLVIACSSPVAFGAPSLDARIGFASVIVPRLYAPTRITVSGLEEAISGTLRVVQYAGALSEEPAEIAIDLSTGSVENATYEASIPIYDPLNPVDIQLLQADGTPLVVQQLNFRLFMRSAPFPLVCETSVDLGGSEVRVGTEELPWEWWGYEAIDSLWLGGAQFDRSAADAITRWILAGGSLVLFSGPDFYKYDPNFLEGVFPVAGATLETARDGVSYVTGTMPERAELAAWREDGTPLLYTLSVGAGAVAFVSIRAEDLGTDEVRTIVSMVRSAKLLSMQGASGTLHGGIRVPRPNYLVAPLIVVAMMTSLAISWRLATRNIPTGLPHRRAPMWIVVGVATIATVFAGFYTNRAKQLVELYQCDTALDIHTSVGCRIVSHTLFAPGFPLDVGVLRSRESVPVYPLIRTARKAVFDSQATPEVLEVPLAAGETRNLRAYGDSRGAVELVTRTDEATIVNRLEVSLSVAYIIRDGELFRVTEIAPGTSTVPLKDGLRVWSLRGLDRFRYADALKVVEAAFPLDEGAWLIAIYDEVEIRSGVETEEKVRDVRIHIVEGEMP